MRSIALTVVIVLLASSTASAAWTYVAPGPMPYVVNYAPVAPVWGPVAPPVMVPGRVVVRRAPVVYAPAAPGVYGRPAPVVYAPPAPVVYAPRPVVRYKVYYPGMPVRNTLRAILP